MVERRDTLEKGADLGVAFIAIFTPSVCAALRGGVGEEVGPVSDTEVGKATSEFGGIMCKAGLEIVKVWIGKKPQ